MTADTVELSVVVPTIGRGELLRDCLLSIAACRPRPAEIVVADQSQGPEVARLVKEFSADSARRVSCPGTGTSRAANCGLRNAGQDLVAVTHDDCTVDSSWAGTAYRLVEGQSDLIVTGKVVPDGEPGSVPSTKVDPNPRDYTGELHCGALYPNNMAFHRASVLSFGAFDERLELAAEDNDLCYRWLRAGKRLRYEPAMVVRHRDWRPGHELAKLYRRYWHWQGIFYAKHLRARDPTVLRFVANDLRQALRYGASRVVRGRPRFPDERAGILRSLPGGLWTGLRIDW